MTTFARSQSFIVKGEIFPFHSWNLDKQRATVHIQYSSF
nr:MAG TPA: NADH-quinone oxidoreductase subunit 7 [Caudoviricetes sp.]